MAQIEHQVATHDAVAVHRVRVTLGALSGVEPDLLLSAFEMMREGTVCRAATLDIQHVPAEWVCGSCGEPIAAGAPLRCTSCGRPARLARGGDMVLEQLELEVGDV